MLLKVVCGGESWPGRFLQLSCNETFEGGGQISLVPLCLLSLRRPRAQSSLL